MGRNYSNSKAKKRKSRLAIACLTASAWQDPGVNDLKRLAEAMMCRIMQNFSWGEAAGSRGRGQHRPTNNADLSNAQVPPSLQSGPHQALEGPFDSLGVQSERQLAAVSLLLRRDWQDQAGQRVLAAHRSRSSNTRR